MSIQTISLAPYKTWNYTASHLAGYKGRLAIRKKDEIELVFPYAGVVKDSQRWEWDPQAFCCALLCGEEYVFAATFGYLNQYKQGSKSVISHNVGEYIPKDPCISADNDRCVFGNRIFSLKEFSDEAKIHACEQPCTVYVSSRDSFLAVCVKDGWLITSLENYSASFAGGKSSSVYVDENITILGAAGNSLFFQTKRGIQTYHRRTLQFRTLIRMEREGNYHLSTAASENGKFVAFAYGNNVFLANGFSDQAEITPHVMWVAHEHAINSVTFLGDRLLATAGSDGKVHVWDLNKL